MKFTRRELKEKLQLSSDEQELILEFQDKLPILTKDAEGFCINARMLHEQLGVSKSFSTWIKTNLEKAMAEENVDYKVFSPQGNNLNGGRPTIEYLTNVEIAKEISMFTGATSQAGDLLKSNSKMARKYFIIMEKAVKSMIEWNKIREPEKELYKELCSELNKYLKRNFNKEAKFYDYTNEADSINLICLGAKAKDIRNYFDAQDRQTREHLTIEYNTYLCEIEKLDIMYLKMNMEKMRRYDLIKQGFKALYPNASFIIANKDKRVI